MLLHSMRRRLLDWYRLRVDIGRLSAVDDRLLADMGIPRDHIAVLVKGRCQ